MNILKPEIVSKCKKSDKLIMQLAEENNIGFRSALRWFSDPISPKVFMLNNLVIIANFFGFVDIDSILQEETENVH